MRKSAYLKARDAEFSNQLLTLKLNLPTYATALGITPDQVTAQAADANYFAYTLAMQEVCRDCSQQWTAWKDLMRDGGDGSAGAPAAAVFPASVPAVEAGIEARFRALVKLIKASPAYNEGIGQILDIEGTVQGSPELGAAKPVLKLELSGGQVLIRWGWQGLAAHVDMIELQVDRGDGKGFVMLSFDTTPDYLDTTALPSAPARWTYKAIFRSDDQRVGQWSDEAGITVGG